MRKLLFSFPLLLFLAGCASGALSEAEKEFLQTTFSQAEVLKGQYEELSAFGKTQERGLNFISYSKDQKNSRSTPFMNPGVFWVKVSLEKTPVQPAELQPPVLTVFMPAFDKYFKVRMTTVNLPLRDDLTKAFARAALSAGGQDARWNNAASQAQTPTRRSSRRGMF